MNQLKKVLRHLTNAPIAVALAFLLVGAPAAPVTQGVPSSGVAYAMPPEAPPPGTCNGGRDDPPECYQTGWVAVLLQVIVGIIGTIAATLGIIDSCTDGYCGDKIDEVQEHFDDQTRDMVDFVRSYCLQNRADPVCCRLPPLSL